MNAKNFHFKVGVWLVISFLLFLVIWIQQDLTKTETRVSLSMIALAGFLGFGLIVRLSPLLEIDTETITSLESPDGIVTGTIETADILSPIYICHVRRNYQDAVYDKREEFRSLNKAKLWLVTVYDEELEKHQERIQKSFSLK